MTSTGGGRRRLVVYTALVGAKEALKNPLVALPADASSDLELDFVCLTDNRELRSDVWRFEYLPTRHLPPEKLSRRPKALPHEYFAGCDHSLYIDNTVTFKRLPQANDLDTAQPYLFRAFRHARHTQLDQEAYAIAALGYEEVGTICRQLAFCASRTPLDSITPLTTATVLLRSHHDETVRRFGSLWWESILAFSKRDQLSFDFALRQAGAAVDYFPGVTRDNPFIHWQGSLAPSRLRASFDPVRYAWLHRGDAAAVADPAAHALAHGRGGDAPYQRPTQLLEYLCFAQQSSLGSQVSPRRGLADGLASVLQPYQRAGARCLLVRIQDSRRPHAFSPTEFDSASRALAMYLGAGVETALFDVPEADLAATSKVFSAQGSQPYDLVLVLGVAGDHLEALVQKVARLAAPDAGALVLALTQPVDLVHAALGEQQIGRLVKSPVRTMMSASRHDDEPGWLPNTLVAYAWAPAAPAGEALRPA